MFVILENQRFGGWTFDQVDDEERIPDFYVQIIF
jgi:hypothetical protein